MKPETTSSAATVLGRLLRSPQEQAELRLALVRRLLAQGGGWWTAEEVAAQPGEIEDLRAGLKELRRIGVLWWDSDIGGYALVEDLRVPLALTLLACDAPQQQDQLLLLDRLLPFAQLASRGDAQAAPAWAMMDLLARDVRALKQLNGPIFQWPSLKPDLMTCMPRYHIS